LLVWGKKEIFHLIANARKAIMLLVGTIEKVLTLGQKNKKVIILLVEE
jgi:hypothetical protein